MFHALISILLRGWVIYIKTTQPLSKCLDIFVILVPNIGVSKIIFLDMDPHDWLIQYNSPVTGLSHYPRYTLLLLDPWSNLYRDM